MKRLYDGYNDEALIDSTTDVRELITGADFDGDLAAFWLKYIIIRNSDAANDAIVDIYDQNEGVAVSTNLRFAIDVPKGQTIFFEIPSPGASFLTNLTAGLRGGLGTISIGNVHAGGNLVGSMKG